MIPEDGENTINSMDMIGSFPDNSRRVKDSNNDSVSKDQIENDVLKAKPRKTTLKGANIKLSVIDENDDRDVEDNMSFGGGNSQASTASAAARKSRKSRTRYQT